MVPGPNRAALDRMHNDLYPSRHGRWDERIDHTLVVDSSREIAEKIKLIITVTLIQVGDDFIEIEDVLRA